MTGRAAEGGRANRAQLALVAGSAFLLGAGAVTVALAWFLGKRLTVRAGVVRVMDPAEDGQAARASARTGQD